MVKNLSLCFILLCSLQLTAQTRKSALFLGNSYTAYNNLPKMVSDIAISLGDTLDYDSNTPGGYTLEGHSTNATSFTKINSQSWDYVILQEQSQKPSFSPAQVAQEVYPFAQTLKQQIKANDSCTQVMFYMTWGRKYGDANNCQFYPPVCTYAGMQKRLRASYLYMGLQHGEVAPVGAAWQLTRAQDSTIDLYIADNSHPSLAGSYLAACVFYASTFHKSPVGAFVPSSLNSSHAAILQENARKVVLDSLANWFIDTGLVAASYTHFQSNALQVTFSNTSTPSDNYVWDFGDGNTSTASSPIHTYLLDGNYPVRLIAYRDCKVDTFMDTITVTNVGIEEAMAGEIKVFPNPAFSSVNLSWAIGYDFNFLELINLQGKIVRETRVFGTEIKLDLSALPSAVYFARLSGKKGTRICKVIKE